MTALTALSLAHIREEPVADGGDAADEESSGSQDTELLLDWTKGVTEVSDEELDLLRESPDLRSVPTVQRLLARGEREPVLAALRSPRARAGFQTQALILLSADVDPGTRDLARTLVENPRSHPKVKSVCKAILGERQDETEREE